uniref:C2 domain-containing protein n=1 Tax=Terrapene triunguis TaxID=2587831 RepID=A0A674K2Y2_9SAUR
KSCGGEANGVYVLTHPGLFRWPHYGKLIMEEMLLVKVYNCSKVFTYALSEQCAGAQGSEKQCFLGLLPALARAVSHEADKCVCVSRPADVKRAHELDKKATALGRKLVKGLETDEEEEEYDDESDMEFLGIVFSPVKRYLAHDLSVDSFPMFPQIGINVIEAQKLVGVNIDPFVVVKVGEEKRHTATQKSTNCPFYNEVRGMGQGSHWQSVQSHLHRSQCKEGTRNTAVFHSKKIPFLGTRIGTFKIDAETVYSQPGTVYHRFFQKWAVINDPKDTRAGVKGFVKCNISVFARGDIMGSLPTSSSSQNEDIEKNLLLPKRVPAERPWAKICIKVYRAEGLPSMSAGIMGGFSKIVGEKKVFIDPYVQVSFAGQQGETSVENDTAEPEWNEQISFIEMFPPLARKIKVQLLDDANIGDVALATHFIDLQQISDPGRNGFNPTFGPSWVNLYGSPQNSALRDVHKDLNEGLGEGIFYRGRILLAISMEIFSSPSAIDGKRKEVLRGTLSKLTLKKKKSKKAKEKSKASAKEQSQRQGGDEAGSPEEAEQPSEVTVEVEELHPLPENSLGVKEEFLLYAAFFEVTMMDPSIGSKPVRFEISIGNYGKAEEVVTKMPKKGQKGEGPEDKQPLLDPTSDEELDIEVMAPSPTLQNKSMTESQRPEPTEYDSSYSCLPLLHEKPCVYVWSYWEDHTWRLYNSNWIVKIAERLVKYSSDWETPLLPLALLPPSTLSWAGVSGVLGGRQARCRPVTGVLCVQILYAKQGLRVRRRLIRANVKEKVNDAKRILGKLRSLAKEVRCALPQCTLPDVLLWMFSNNKRVAYTRIPAQNVLYSVVEEEKGKDCAKIQTVFLKVPGSRTGEIFAKLEIYMWLGVTKYVKNSTTELPEEFKPQPSDFCFFLPDFSYFQLRAHLYQARGILPADDNGLSDPFARVVFSTQCQTTRTLEETLSPLWNELLLYDQLIIDGRREDLKTETPVVVINIFDHNKFGSPEFLGRAFATPQVKLVDEPYCKPALQFFDIYKGARAAGELIATFELIELDYSGYLEPSVPKDVEPKEPDFLEDPHSGRFIIPEGIRPILKEFRIEILFWGLRDLKRVNLFEVDQPQVIIECAGKKVESEVVVSYKENPNFNELVKYINVVKALLQELPEQVYLHPPLSIFVVEQRAFGRTVLVGTHVVSHIMKFSPRELEELEEGPENPPKGEFPGLNCATHPLTWQGGTGLSTAPLKKIPINKLIKKEDEFEEEKPELEELDWWSKYYESLKEMSNQVMVCHFLCPLLIYNSELENEFDNFEDWLYIFPLHRGKANEDEDGNEDENFVGKYKGSFFVYPAEEAGTEHKISQGVPRNRPIKVLVRVYIVKATNLAPADPNGKADPYVVVTLGQEKKDTKDRYIPKQLHPVFGEVMELSISFPMESELTVSIFDHDLVGSDDLIGETKIDLENRFYSKHRANCGMASQYDTYVPDHGADGYNMWRDAFKPTQILESLCKKSSLPSAEYRREEVKVNNKIFKVPPEAFPEGTQKALYVLQHWDEMPEYGHKLVPEHVEIRGLYNAENPGLVQGSLHMWIDMFPNDVPAPPPVNIKPRLPISYELRVIIWNTDDVVLDDVNPITGETSSDIYVKSWIKGLDHEKQETDVHFNSLTGEGNFNWRFVFHFDYLPTEKEISYKKKDSIFSLEESEFREPAVLVLQVWDYDRISANDFLGSIELKLNDMVRAAKSSEQCTVKMAKEKATPRFSIFRNKRMRGWWPFIKLKDQEDEEREEREAKEKKKKKKKKRRSIKPEDIEFTDPSGNKYLLTGKVEAEFQLLTVEEAEKSPVGLGRKEPEPLEKPNRPKTSFNWFVNPMKTFIFFIWKRYKKYIIALVIIAVVTIFLVLLLYTMPGYISQKIING